MHCGFEQGSSRDGNSSQNSSSSSSSSSTEKEETIFDLRGKAVPGDKVEDIHLASLSEKVEKADIKWGCE